jgi:hypothetical protein
MYQADGATPVEDAHTIMVTNERSGTSVTTILGSCGEAGKYSVVLLDAATNNAAQVGDLFTLEAVDNCGGTRAYAREVVTLDQIVAQRTRIDTKEGEGVPSASTSQLSADDYFPCVGETIEIRGGIRDRYGTPVHDVIVSFYSDRGAGDVIAGSPDITEANGYADARMTTLVPGTCHIWADLEWRGSALTVGPSQGIQWSGASGVERATWGSIKALYK